jgi:hypothetical protein
MPDYDGLYHRLFRHPRMVAHDAESVVMRSRVLVTERTTA